MAGLRSTELTRPGYVLVLDASPWKYRPPPPLVAAERLVMHIREHMTRGSLNHINIALEGQNRRPHCGSGCLKAGGNTEDACLPVLACRCFAARRERHEWSSGSTPPPSLDRSATVALPGEGRGTWGMYRHFIATQCMLINKYMNLHFKYFQWVSAKYIAKTMYFLSICEGLSCCCVSSLWRAGPPVDGRLAHLLMMPLP